MERRQGLVSVVSKRVADERPKSRVDVSRSDRAWVVGSEGLSSKWRLPIGCIEPQGWLRLGGVETRQDGWFFRRTNVLGRMILIRVERTDFFGTMVSVA